jgi:hypothetical protein
MDARIRVEGEPEGAAGRGKDRLTLPTLRRLLERLERED